MVKDLSVLASKEGYRLEQVRGGRKETALLRFRHRIFREELRWVPVSVDGLDRDEYDGFSENLGVFVNQRVVGSVRMTPGHQRFMIEKEFSALLPAGWSLRKGADCAEVTRFAVEADQRGRRLEPAAMLLYHCLYRWAELNHVRWMYFVVEPPFYRRLARMGFPIFPIGEAKPLDGGVVSQAAYFDWRHAKPEFIRWLRQAVEYPVAIQAQSHASGYWH
ncbi:MAG: GNAT family N-acetyltransferase [Paludibacterium sp.]|uniref:acyl-homoserine-lactone synthase n=1 Tax=Paludibacterium sp. TaxID=1917523 RepID=UPI0025F90BD7|nr:acyl-homoserine-lactone synthase [Paludibacterium sp.]MBV8046462.1 GNAT family N-acetyltransferase [Paludibacterium sp.]MBV8646177.1 GNAT family N-acetyltransferase [Paludibacterium sp.]